MWTPRYGVYIKVLTDHIKQILNKSEDYDNQEVPRDCRHAPTLI